MLFVDGQPIFDSTTILEFIEDRFPEPALLPADPLARTRAPIWIAKAGCRRHRPA